MNDSLRAAMRMVLFSFGDGYAQFSRPRRVPALVCGLLTFLCLGTVLGYLLVAVVSGEGLSLVRVRILVVLSLVGGAALMSLMVVAVAELVDKRDIEGQMAAAAQIQARLMPKTPPEVPGYAVSTFHTPAKAVGGDLYDFRRFGDQLLIVIADVSGKGLPAAIVMAGVRNRIRAVASPMSSLPELVGNLNRALVEDTGPSRHVTLVVARLAVRSGAIEYVSAGHVPPLIVGAESAHWLEPTGMPVGLFADATYRSGRARLQPGETLVLVTDGVTEAENRRGEMFGLDRMIEAVRSVTGDASATDALRHNVKKFIGRAELFDDLTIVAVARR